MKSTHASKILELYIKYKDRYHSYEDFIQDFQVKNPRFILTDDDKSILKKFLQIKVNLQTEIERKYLNAKSYIKASISELLFHKFFSDREDITLDYLNSFEKQVAEISITDEFAKLINPIIYLNSDNSLYSFIHNYLIHNYSAFLQMPIDENIYSKVPKLVKLQGKNFTLTDDEKDIIKYSDYLYKFLLNNGVERDSELFKEAIRLLFSHALELDELKSFLESKNIPYREYLDIAAYMEETETETLEEVEVEGFYINTGSDLPKENQQTEVNLVSPIDSKHYSFIISNKDEIYYILINNKQFLLNIEKVDEFTTVSTAEEVKLYIKKKSATYTASLISENQNDVRENGLIYTETYLYKLVKDGVISNIKEFEEWIRRIPIHIRSQYYSFKDSNGKSAIDFLNVTDSKVIKYFEEICEINQYNIEEHEQSSHMFDYLQSKINAYCPNREVEENLNDYLISWIEDEGKDLTEAEKNRVQGLILNQSYTGESGIAEERREGVR